MKKLSLRLRLLIIFGLSSCLIWLGAGALSWLESKEKTDEFFDQYQMILARQLASADWSAITPDVQKATDKIIKKIDNADEEDEAIGFAVFDKNGQMVFHDNENGKDFIFNPRMGRFVNQVIDDDDDWRIVWIDSVDKKYVIAVGQELEYREEVALDMLEEFLLPWLLGLFLLLLVIIYFVGREFASFKRLALDLEKRAADDLSPLKEYNLPQEILPLTQAMNGLFMKLAEMLKKEKSFISDSAHELRSPLTALKVQLEVLEMSQEDNEARKDAIVKMERGIERCARLVEQLLLLSRLESNQSQATSEPIDWRQTVDILMKEYQSQIKDKQITTEISVTSGSPISCGNSVLLTVMLRNLLDNAIKYSSEGTEIMLDIDEQHIKVANSGVVMPNQHLQRLGERFFRPAGQKQIGSGLGLSIVKKIAALHGCAVEIKNDDNLFSVIIANQK